MKPAEIKAALVLRGVRQADIARQVGHAGAFVHDVIAGKRRSLAIEQAVAAALGKPLKEVFPGQAYAPPTHTVRSA